MITTGINSTITGASFGFDADYPYLFGLKICVTSSLAETPATLRFMVNTGAECVWNSVEEKALTERRILAKTQELLRCAQVTDVASLIGLPVRVELDKCCIKSITFITEKSLIFVILAVLRYLLERYETLQIDCDTSLRVNFLSSLLFLINNPIELALKFFKYDLVFFSSS